MMIHASEQDRHRVGRPLGLAGAALLVTIAICGDAWAYLDPGTGSYVLQMLIAAALGALLTAKIWWAKFIGIFKKHGSSDAIRADKRA